VTIRRHGWLQRRWGTPFGGFVREYGAQALARRLSARGFSISDQAVYNWVSGRTAPRLEIIEAIEEESKGRIGFKEIRQHAREVKG